VGPLTAKDVSFLIRRSHLMTWKMPGVAAFFIVAIGFFLLSGIARPSQNPTSTAGAHPVAMIASSRTYASIGIELSPPSISDVPSIDAIRAAAICRSSQAWTCPAGPVQELALFTDTQYGPTDPSQPRTFSHVLSWIFSAFNVQCNPFDSGLPPPPGATAAPILHPKGCDHVLVFSALTGEKSLEFWAPQGPAPAGSGLPRP
jgi:hypothetical protein